METDLGLLSEARASAQESLDLAEAAANAWYTITSHAALGRIELASGDHEAAYAHLADIPGRLQAGGIADPSMPLWSDAIETLVVAGELDRARLHLEQYEAHAARTESPWAIGVAARARALLAAKDGDLDGAVEAGLRSVDVLTASRHPFEQRPGAPHSRRDAASRAAANGAARRRSSRRCSCSPTSARGSGPKE